MSEILTAIAIWCQPLADLSANQKCRNKIINCLKTKINDQVPTIAQVWERDTFACFEKREIDKGQ